MLAVQNIWIAIIMEGFGIKAKKLKERRKQLK